MSLEFIKESLKKYYEQQGVRAPPYTEKREFGFGSDKKIDYRHAAFKNEEELKKHFVEHVPLYASFSAAYYEFPGARPMEKKNFQGADLIFEFDAACEHKTLTCYKCLDEMKAETARLIEEFLIPDFGFKQNEIKVTFSGGRGYHIYVVNDVAFGLNANARREIADYLQARNFDVDKLISSKATPDSGGWYGRLSAQALEYAMESKEKKFADKEDVKRRIESGNYDFFKSAHRTWARILEKQRLKLSAHIDQGLTLDIARLIRIPSTIHGGTGLICDYVKKLDLFDPFRDMVVFYNIPVKIKTLEDIAELSLNDQTFGPYKKDLEVEVPEYLAVFLACKHVAEVIKR